MTPEGILKAMAEALAKKFKGSDLDEPMVKVRPSGVEAPTPRQAAVTVMEAVGPVLELLFRLTETARQMAKSHQEFIDEWARHDVDAHTMEVQYVMESLLGQIEVKEPADWGYVSRFSATPREIHDILRSGLTQPVLKAFIDAVKAGEFDSPEG